MSSGCGSLHMMSAWENKKVLASVRPAGISQRSPPQADSTIQAIFPFLKCILVAFFFLTGLEKKLWCLCIQRVLIDFP